MTDRPAPIDLPLHGEPLRPHGLGLWRCRVPKEHLLAEVIQLNGVIPVRASMRHARLGDDVGLLADFARKLAGETPRAARVLDWTWSVAGADHKIEFTCQVLDLYEFAPGPVTAEAGAPMDLEPGRVVELWDPTQRARLRETALRCALPFGTPPPSASQAERLEPVLRRAEVLFAWLEKGNPEGALAMADDEPEAASFRDWGRAVFDRILHAADDRLDGSDGALAGLVSDLSALRTEQPESARSVARRIQKAGTVAFGRVLEELRRRAKALGKSEDLVRLVEDLEALIGMPAAGADGSEAHPGHAGELPGTRRRGRRSGGRR